ncbi:hypothetical protein [Bacillus sp. OK048]|uniref:hypothetical protein n=1 Tax=Bacillus sp. OK048 TaxID=1882761 RepID=UPI0008815CEC|nr:hypothetical protein [Bacillus sp. OK048]SDM41798.1 hypothetical protein SAMN05443253_103242 [Bacillus sp. OK048]
MTNKNQLVSILKKAIDESENNKVIIDLDVADSILETLENDEYHKNRRRLGYLLLSCKEAKIPKSIVSKMVNGFGDVLKKYDEEDIEELGIEYQLGLDVEGYGVFGKQIMEEIYPERMYTYEKLFQWENTEKGDQAIETTSIIQPIRKADLEMLRNKYRGGKVE